MRPGRLRHPLELQQATAEQTRHGSPRQTWATVAERRGHIAEQSGREIVKHEQWDARRPVLITVRWYRGLDSSYRWKLGTRIFNIKSVVDPDSRHRWSECICEEDIA